MMGEECIMKENRGKRREGFKNEKCGEDGQIYLREKREKGEKSYRDTKAILKTKQ